MKILNLNVYRITICIILQLSNTQTTLIYSYSGQLCVSECALNGNKFECRISIYNDRIACSTERGITTSGTKCRNGHECDRHGNDYYWCYTDSLNNWDYCGITMPEYPYGVAKTYGVLCDDQCLNRGYSYQWCHTSSGWDYCGYFNQFLTRYGDRCFGDCKLYKDYYYCEIASEYPWFNTNAWDYCSNDILSTIRGKRCRDDHSCNKYGYKYYWCYTDNDNNWDYCSLHTDFNKTNAEN